MQEGGGKEKKNKLNNVTTPLFPVISFSSLYKMLVYGKQTPLRGNQWGFSYTIVQIVVQ